MADAEVARRLTTIVAGDVAGYSRLVSEDEEGTFAALRAHRRELIDPKIAEYRGRIANTAGDSILIEFSSVIEALRCVIDIQQGMVERNADVPEERRIQFRVGVNLGDVIEQEDGDLLGDGVNVAARLEGLAEPGGICISRAARDQVRDRMEVVLEDLGEVEVKNIARPVRIFRVLPEGETPTAPPRRWPGKKFPAAAAIVVLLVPASVGLWWWQPWLKRVEAADPAKMAFALPDEPSLAVLPFDNLTGVPDRQFLIDGFVDQLITMLSLNPDVLVISRNAAFSFRGQSAPIGRIAEELGVRYVIEGSLQQAGERLRINVQLIDAIKGFHVWSKAYDRPAGDFFAVQDDVISAVSVELLGRRGEILAAEQTRLRDTRSENLTIYELSEKANAAYAKFTKEGNEQTREYSLAMLELEPDNGRAHAFLAWVELASIWYGWTDDREAALQRACELAEKAIDLDRRDYQGHWAAAYCYVATDRPEDMVRAFEEALRLNPAEPMIVMQHASRVLAPAGRIEEAIARVKKIERTNPKGRIVDHLFGNLAALYYQQGDYPKAIEYLSHLSKTYAKGGWQTMKVAALYHAGEHAKARTEAEALMADFPDLAVTDFVKKGTIPDAKTRASIAEALKTVGVPVTPPLKLPEKPSIAVLPFQNMSDDKEQDYFADGMAEDIITDLSKLSGLFVIARNSSFQFRGGAVDVKQVGRELGVMYVLEGSVRRAGDQVRINAQLVDAQSGGHLWAERYDGTLADVFKLQDQVTKRIVTALSVNLTAQDRLLQSQIETQNPEAYDAFLRGWSHYRRNTPDDYAKAIPYLNQAIELDPEYRRAYATLAVVYWNSFANARLSRGGEWVRSLDLSLGDTFDRVVEILKHAKRANPAPLAYQVSAGMYVFQGQYAEAMTEATQAVSLDGNDPAGYEALGTVSLFSGNPQDSVDAFRTAIRLDPQHAYIYEHWLGLALYSMGQFEEAASLLVNASRRNPDDERVLIPLAAAHGMLGRVDAAEKTVGRLNDLRKLNTDRLKRSGLEPGIDLYLLGPLTLQDMDLWPFKNPSDRERLREGLRRVGVPESGPSDTGSPLQVPGAITVDAAAAKALFDRGAKFIDVRGPSWNLGRIPGAVHLFLKDAFTETSLASVADRDEEIVIYCMGPACLLSSKASARAVSWGCKNVHYFRDGFPSWQAANYPVEYPEK